MTDQIPPPPGDAHMPPPPLGGGGYPPPPPPSGGYVPPPPGPVIRGLSKESYTPWLTRVAAFVIDRLPVALIIGVGYLVLQNSVQSACLTDISPYSVDQICSIGYSTMGLSVMTIAGMLALAFLIWNLGYRQGATGSSIGKSVLKFRVVSEKTGQAHRFRVVRAARDHPSCRLGHLLRRLSVSAVGRQASDAGRQDHGDGVPAT